MRHNYKTLLNISYRNYAFILIIILISSLLLFAILKNTYDTYNTYTLYHDNYYIVNVPVSSSDEVLKGSFIKINKKIYKYEVLYISEILNEDNINYQEYHIKIANLDGIENEINSITFYSNKEKIITKIAKIII